MSNLFPLNKNESDPNRLWVVIHVLEDRIKGPKGFETWEDAAINERLKRVAAEKELADLRSQFVWWDKSAGGFYTDYKTIPDLVKNSHKLQPLGCIMTKD